MMTGQCPEESRAARSTSQMRTKGDLVPVAGLWRGALTALLSGQGHNIVGASDSEAARIALAVGNFLAVYQRVAVFDLLGMVAATVRARGHLSLIELHVPHGMRQSDHSVGFG
jgi:hypothetical protein